MPEKIFPVLIFPAAAVAAGRSLIGRGERARKTEKKAIGPAERERARLGTVAGEREEKERNSGKKKKRRDNSRTQ